MKSGSSASMRATGAVERCFAVSSCIQKSRPSTIGESSSGENHGVAFANLPAGAYQIVVVSRNGSFSTRTINIDVTESAIAFVPVVSSDASCGLANGTIDLNFTSHGADGDRGATILINDQETNYQLGDQVTGLAPGDYKIVWRRDAGAKCECEEQRTLTIREIAQPTFESITSSPTDCSA